MMQVAKGLVSTFPTGPQETTHLQSKRDKNLPIIYPGQKLQFIPSFSQDTWVQMDLEPQRINSTQINIVFPDMQLI